MRSRPHHDAVVVGAGPNGLTAALTLAAAGLDVLVVEEQTRPGGGARTMELGLAPGVHHDLCSAVHPLAWVSPVWRELGVSDRVSFATPAVSYAQPLADREAALAWLDLDCTVADLGPGGHEWDRLMRPLALAWREVAAVGLGPRSLPTLRQAAATSLRFAAATGLTGTGVRPAVLGDERTQALFAGLASHANVPMPSLVSSATALLLGALGHAGRGWPLPRGGSQAITDALLSELGRRGVVVRCATPVRSLADLPPARVYLFDTTEAGLRDIAGRPPSARSRHLGQRTNGAVCKVDLVLVGPIAWSDPRVALAGTIHIGGTRAEMELAARTVAAGRHPARPTVLLSDPGQHDPERLVGDLRPVWAYAQVPQGSPRDMTAAVLAQLERFAPGARDLVVASQAIPASQMHHHNRNYRHGDIAGGPMSLSHLLLDPLLTADPYRMGETNLYLCSAARPPGPGCTACAGIWRLAPPSITTSAGVIGCGCETLEAGRRRPGRQGSSARASASGGAPYDEGWEEPPHRAARSLMRHRNGGVMTRFAVVGSLLHARLTARSPTPPRQTSCLRQGARYTRRHEKRR